MNICVIPAKGNSRRIKRKNIRDFHGRPIIAYSIETAQRSGLFEKIWVSSQDEEVGALVRSLGVEWYFRKPELCRDEVGTMEVTTDCLRNKHRADTDYACCIYPTAPLMSVDDLKKGLEILDKMANINETSWYCFAVSYPPLRDAAQFYWGTMDAWFNGRTLIGPWTHMHRIDHKRVCDINTETDWKRAEKMYEDLHR